MRSIKSRTAWSYAPFGLTQLVWTLASFIASVALEDYERSIQVTTFGLKANPANFMLLNNQIFALGRLGRIREATKLFATIDPTTLHGQEHVTWQATKGLLAYRAGRISEGQQFYETAIQEALSLGDKPLAARAILFQIVEEINAGVEGAEKYRQDILNALDKRDIRDYHFMPILHHLRTFKRQPVSELKVLGPSNLEANKAVLNRTLEDEVFAPRVPLM